MCNSTHVEPWWNPDLADNVSVFCVSGRLAAGRFVNKFISLDRSYVIKILHGWHEADTFMRVVSNIYICSFFILYDYFGNYAWCTMHCDNGGMTGLWGSVCAPGVKCLMHWRIWVAPECLQFHSAWHIMLKFYSDMNKSALMHYKTEICKQSSVAGNVDGHGGVSKTLMSS